MSTIKPLIKWSGSKRSQADQLASFIPTFRRYYEPFVGGGSMLYRVSPEEAVVGDSCKPLIDLWEAVKTCPDRVASEYRSMWEALQKTPPFTTQFGTGLMRTKNLGTFCSSPEHA